VNEKEDTDGDEEKRRNHPEKSFEEIAKHKTVSVAGGV
jgi:hypothetical protein